MLYWCKERRRNTLADVYQSQKMFSAAVVNIRLHSLKYTYIYRERERERERALGLKK